MTSVITKCDKCYNKLWQVLLQSVTSVVKKVWQVLLQSVTSVITKCDRKLSHLLLFLIPEFIFFALNFFQVSPSASVRRAIHNPPHLLGHSAESKCKSSPSSLPRGFGTWPLLRWVWWPLISINSLNYLTSKWQSTRQANSPFYSCVLGCQAFEQEWG